MDDAEASDFVDRFETWWAAPDPENLDTLLDPDVVLLQPILPRTVGLVAAQRSFRRLLAAVPDLTGTVHGWAAKDTTVFIEFTLSGTLGGRPLAWPNVDRFVVGPHGRAIMRVNFHDSVALVGKMTTRPRGWPPLLRSGLLLRR